HRTPDANTVVGRHRPDCGRRDSGHKQRNDQRRFASDAVAPMTEDGRADRSANKADEENGESLQDAYNRIGLREEQLAEDESCYRPVEQKVIPFYRRPDGASDDGSPQLRLMLLRRDASWAAVGGCHGPPSSPCCRGMSSHPPDLGCSEP